MADREHPNSEDPTGGSTGSSEAETGSQEEPQAKSVIMRLDADGKRVPVVRLRDLQTDAPLPELKLGEEK